jgi:hypothetical protein
MSETRMGNGFAEWLAAAMKNKKVGDTRVGNHLGVSATAVIRWRQGAAIPRDVEMIGKMADYFEADRALVYTLAGRGFAGMEEKEVRQDYLELALALQGQEDSLTDPADKRAFFDLVKLKVNEIADIMEWSNSWRKK